MDYLSLLNIDRPVITLERALASFLLLTHKVYISFLRLFFDLYYLTDNTEPDLLIQSVSHDVPNYEYQRLSCERSFRLLKVKVKPGIIECTLNIFRLDECPDYCALSYTWGQAEHDWAQDNLARDVEEDRAPEWTGIEDASTGQPEIAQDDVESNNETLSEESGDEDAGLEEAEAEETQQQAKADDTEDINDTSGDDGSRPGEGLRDSCLPIIVNDKRLMVTPNLYDALCFIRRSKLSRHHFWIDAICIDQQHVDERNAQVMLMGGIYERAGKVIIWLGKENASSGRVLRMVSRLAHSWTELQAEFGLPRNANAEAFRPFRDPYGYENPVVLRRLGLEDTQQSDWLDLFLFLQRRWFQRQ